MNNENVYRMLKHRAEVRDFRQANADKRRPFWNGAYRYDAPLKDERGKEQEDRTLSDKNKGAEVIYRLGQDPAWKVEMVRVLDGLDKVEQRIVDALFEDPRPACAARIAGTNRQRIYRVMAKLKTKLAQAHALLKAGE